jgi:hypothetical protein
MAFVSQWPPSHSLSILTGNFFSHFTLIAIFPSHIDPFLMEPSHTPAGPFSHWPLTHKYCTAYQKKGEKTLKFPFFDPANRAIGSTACLACWPGRWPCVWKTAAPCTPHGPAAERNAVTAFNQYHFKRINMMITLRENHEK